MDRPLQLRIARAVFTPQAGRDEEGTMTTFHSPHMGGAFATARLFGGQAVSQCYQAFQQQSHDGGCVHSMHYNFNAPGTVIDPIEYRLHVGVGEGEDSGVGRVSSIQKGRVIGSGHCRYTPVCDLSPAPNCDLGYLEGPMEYTSLDELLEDMPDSTPEKQMNRSNVFEMRQAEFPFSPETETTRSLLWGRIHPHLKDDLGPINGLAVAFVLSDFYIIGVAIELVKQQGLSVGAAASLHHTVYVHKQDVDPYGWFLYRVECDAISHHRAKLHAWVYDESRECVLSIIQEAYVEMKDKKERQRAKL